MIKKLILAILSISIFLAGSVPTFAAQIDTEVGKNDITVEEIYTSANSDTTYNFDEKIEKDGHKYKLKGINYQVIGEDNVTKEETITHKVEYNDLYTKDAAPADTLTITQDGQDITVQLKGTTYSDTVIENRTTTISAYTDYDFKTVKPNPAKTKTVSYYDEPSGKTVTRTLNFKELKEEAGWAWRADVTIPITFSFYDSEYYVLGDKYVPYNDEKPALEGYENDLLKELKLDPYKYRITSVEWDGAAYQAGDISYRKALAHGERYTANYVAYYESTVNLPDTQGYNAIAEYEGQAKILTGAKKYTIQAIAVYAPDHTPAIVAGVVGGLIIIVLLIVVILYVLSKKQKRRGDMIESGTYNG